MNNPTIVSAALSDKELQDSINKMVANFDKGLQDMLDHSNKYVEKIQESLQKIGNTNFGAKGSNDGGVAKQTKAQNDFTDAVKKSTNEIKNQGKQGEMSLDQIQGALQMAMREVRKWESHKTFSTQDLDKYQASLARVVELNEKLKRAKGGETYTRFDELSKRTAFDAKATIRDLTAVDDRLKQLNNEYKKLEAESKKAFGQDLKDAFKLPTTSLDEVTKKILRLKELAYRGQDQGFISQSQIKNIDNAVIKLRELQREMESKLVPLSFTKQTEMENKALQEQKEHLERIKSIAKEVKEDIGRSGFAQITNYKGVVYAENDARSKGLTIEQQIEKIIQEENAARNARLSTEKQITQEVEKQKKEYVAPSSYKSLVVPSMLRPFVEEKLGLGFGGAITSDATSKIKTINAEIKQLNETWQKMSDWERKSPFGDTLRQRMQMLQRQSQQLNQQLSRPVSLKDALSGSEKTLDDIAYKMQRLRAYKQVIDLTKPNAANEIKQVDDALARLQKDADKWMSKSQQMIKSNTALGRSWNYMKNRLAFYFTVGASTQFIKNLVEVRSQYEMNERALGILINSAERGTQIFNELSQMALVSPYTLIELSAAAKQLTAYDVAAKDVVDTTRRLADMAAAVGIPIERLTYALGQIKAYGYLNSRDNRMFANAGIPLVKQLSEYYTELEGRLVSTADVYDRIKNKQVGYEEVMNVISRMTDEGGKFYDFQAKMAETLKVQLANLTLAWNNMLNAMGEESQGVLVGSISALKQLFLHWKDIEHVLYELVAAFGAYKAYQIITTRLMGATAASLDAQILAMKRNKAAMLEKQALTRKLTVDELRQVAAQNQVTAADYRNALSGKNLTKQKALLLVALNKNNVQLKAAIVNMGLLTAQEAANVTTGRALAIVFKSIGISIRNAAMAMKAFMVSNWWMLALGGIYELYHAWDSYNEHVAEVNRSAAEHAKEAYESIKQYLEGDVISALQDNLTKGGKVSSDAEGQKAWDEMREKIELSSSASNVFIARLMQIDDINNRLSAGFGYLEDIQRVAGVMQTLEDDAIKVSTTTLGGLLGEGLKDDLQDFLESKDAVISAYGDIGKAAEELKKQQKSANVGIGNILYDMQEFAKEVKKTTDSIYDIASREGLNTNQQREFFEREISEIAQAEQMGIKETRIYRMQAEQEYYAYAKAQLEEQLQYQQGEQKAATERRLQELQNEFGSNKAMQESFFTWLTEKQDHAVKNMLRGKTQEEIKQGDWLKGANGKWVEEMARKFSKEYGVSFDDLHRLVMNANTWSINIPVFFQTIGQPLTDVQRDYEARTGKKFSSNYLIKDAKSQVEILDILKKKQKEVAQEMETSRKAGGQYWEDNKKRYKEENDALVADIHAYNALTDAEEKANKKSGKGGSKKDVLGDALTKEIQLIGEIQKRYKEYQQIGVNAKDAIRLATEEYGNTLKRTNATLAKYGISTKTSEELAGMNIRDVRDYYKSLLEMAKSTGNAKGIEAIEKALANINVEITKLDYKKITDGLNNELDRLKDEYELAVAIDADPELGNMFADMMGINTDTLPHTVEEYAERYTKELNKYLKKENANIELPHLFLTDDDLSSFKDMVDQQKLNESVYNNIAEAVKKVREMRKKDFEETAKGWDSLIKKYSEYEAKIEEVRKEADKERVSFVKQYGSVADKSLAVRLNSSIAAEQDQSKKEELRAQLVSLVHTLAQGDDVKLKIAVAIDKSQSQQEAKTSFEEFQKSPEWIVATGDLAGMTNKAIGGLIDTLERYKKKAKNLDPKQVKNINNALRKLYKQQREGNPFLVISNAIDQAKARMEDIQPALDSTMSDIIKLEKEIGDTEPTEEQAKALDKLKKKWKELYEVGQLSASDIVSGINSAIDVAVKASESFNKMAEALGGTNMTKAAKTISDITGNLQAAGQGAAAGAQLGGGWGAAIGATAGGLTDLVTRFYDQWTGNKAITEGIEESVWEAKKLENAYKSMEYAAEGFYGASVIGIKEAMKANKELQLAELKRQLQLEQQRDSKQRDEEKIRDLQGQIIDLEHEIAKATTETINDLLGVSSHVDFFENMISEMISAFKNGEDAMKVFEEKWSDMIDNMVMKAIIGRVMSQWIDSLEKGANEIVEKYTKEYSQEKANNEQKIQNLATMDAGDFNRWLFENERTTWRNILNQLGEPIPNESELFWDTSWFNNAWDSGLAQRIADMYRKGVQSSINELDNKINNASLDAIDELLNYYGESGKEIGELLKTELPKLLEQYGISYGQDSQSTLSALQQGIAGVTEETASAVESYLNGMSQQAYLRNDLLIQIRDTIMSFDMDVQLGVFSQMLLQLQNNYIVMQSMQSMMENWTVPSGSGIRVELMS